MTTYLIVDTVLTDPDLYEQYKLRAKPIVEKYSGEYLVRGGQLSVKEAALWSPARVVLIRFPTSDQAQAFYQSDEYQAVLGLSAQSARRTVFFVEGL